MLLYSSYQHYPTHHLCEACTPDSPYFLISQWKTIRCVFKHEITQDCQLNRSNRVSLSTSTSLANAQPQVCFCEGNVLRGINLFPDRLITSKDHASVQINIADVDANGRALQTHTSFALCGQVRSQGESDDSLNRLATKAGSTCLFPQSWRIGSHTLFSSHCSAPERVVIPKINSVY